MALRRTLWHRLSLRWPGCGPKGTATARAGLMASTTAVALASWLLLSGRGWLPVPQVALLAEEPIF